MRRGHVKKVGNEQAVIIGFLAFQADARSALVETERVGRVDTKTDDLGLLI